MKLTVRTYGAENDYWRVRGFLREVFRINDPRELSWQAYRFDYWRWHGVENMGHGPLETRVFIWETEDGRIAGVLNPERKQDACMQVHPDLRTSALEEEMLSVAEKHLGWPNAEGRNRVQVWAHSEDDLRQRILVHRGYVKGEQPEYQRRRSMSVPVPDVPVAAGYTVRPLGDVEELPARSLVSWKAFHPDEPDDRFGGWEWYHNIQRAPLYRRDLDIVAAAPSGDFAAFCTVWFDDVTRTGAFEPVGTGPDHQRRGLGKAVMCEGLRRLRRLGARMAYAGSYAPGAHALYASAGFTEYDLSEPWVKQL
jgi:mycothiol synthase